MKNINKFIWIIFPLMILILGWFYWFQFRPSNIRRNCFSSSFKTSKDKADILSLVDGFDEDKRKIDQEEIYQSCLIRNGMKAEVLYIH